MYTVKVGTYTLIHVQYITTGFVKNRYVGVKTATHTATGVYLQFAGSLVITVDLQQVIYVYLYLRHLFLLKEKNSLG